MDIRQAVKRVTDLRYREIRFPAFGREGKPVYHIRFFFGEGLMSMLYRAMTHIEYAEKHGYMPYIDLERYRTQYSVPGENAWERFFTQPKAYDPEQAKKGRYILSSCTPDRSGLKLYGEYWARAFSDYAEKGEYLRERIGVNPGILREMETSGIRTEGSLGVLARGTDYTSLRPKGHPAQPTAGEIAGMIDGALERRDYENIFLVTEDAAVRDRLLGRYGKRILLPEDGGVTEEYREGKMLYQSISAGKINDNARVYLKKILLLSRCEGLVAGKTNGSLMACILNGGKYGETSLFDRGFY